MSTFYVIIQFASIILLILSGPFLPENMMTLILYILSGIVGAFALASMRRSKIRVSPKVHPEATLITTGIYRFVRHPMYLAVILGAIGMLLNQVTVIRSILVIILVIDLIFKMKYEEWVLSDYFPNYSNYQKSTKAIIPFIL